MIFLTLLMLLPQAPSDQAVSVAVEAAQAAEASTPKIDCAEHVTQAEMNVCSFEDFQAADAALNELWEAVVLRAKRADAWSANHKFLGGEQPRLLEAQRAWLKFRDAECLYEIGPQGGGGTIWPLLHNGCLKRLTEAHIGQLRAMLEPND